MDMVRHDAPCEEPVSLVVEVQQCSLNEAADILSAEPTGTQTGVEFLVDFRWWIVSLTKHFCDLSRQAVGEPKCHELHRFGRVEVRQVAS